MQPSLVAIWRHRYNENRNAVLARISIVGNIWNFHLVKNPLEFVKDSKLVFSEQDTWFNKKEMNILVERTCKNNTKHIYESSICFANHNLILKNNTVIPVVDISNKCLVLPSPFVKIDNSQYSSWRFEMKYNLNDILIEGYETLKDLQDIEKELMCEMPEPSAPLDSIYSQRIVNELIENAVEKKDLCPITIAPLEKESTCLIPCGHTMTLDAGVYWIQGAHSCPICRSSVETTQIQKWSPL